MTEIYLTDGREITKEHVTVKANGWVKTYDSVLTDGVGGVKEYDGLNHYPAHMVENIKGEVNYESPHGRV